MKCERLCLQMKNLLGVFVLLLIVSFLFSSCTKDDEIIDELEEKNDTEDKVDVEEEAEEDGSSDEAEEETDEDSETDGDTDEEGATEEDGNNEDDSTNNENGDDSGDTTNEGADTDSEEFDVIYKPLDKIYFDIEKVDLTGINRIKVIGVNTTKWIGVGSLVEHEKYILVDVTETTAKVSVGGINNTIELIGLESPSCKKLLVFDKDPASSRVYKNNGKVYIEILPVIDSLNNSGTKILVYIGLDSELTDVYIQEQHARVMDVNVENSIW